MSFTNTTLTGTEKHTEKVILTDADATEALKRIVNTGRLSEHTKHEILKRHASRIEIEKEPRETVRLETRKEALSNID